MDNQNKKGATGTDQQQQHVDERTQRRAGEAQHGGKSSQESAEAYRKGENPGGTHQGGDTEGAVGATHGHGDFGGKGATGGDEGEGRPNPYEEIGVKKGRD
ncbi:hypothetical protein [Sorangium sp. So ce1078]|uniref:hypothetical protein n=1 Tax=Sorangium sp. So ce1078 TaxID=3133329 RepID=UPI003F610CC5